MGGFDTKRTMIGAIVLVVALSPLVWAQTGEETVEGGAFNYEERSTLETIPFNSMEEESLANTVIEGGLEAPAAGVPVQPRTDEDFYLDPLPFSPVIHARISGEAKFRSNSASATPSPFPGKPTATTTLSAHRPIGTTARSIPQRRNDNSPAARVQAATMPSGSVLPNTSS